MSWFVWAVNFLIIPCHAHNNWIVIFFTFHRAGLDRTICNNIPVTFATSLLAWVGKNFSEEVGEDKRPNMYYNNQTLHCYYFSRDAPFT